MASRYVAHALERGGVAADHERELTLLDGDGAARDRCVEERRAARGRRLSEAARGARAHRAHLEPRRSLAKAGQDSVRAVSDGVERLGVADHAEQDVDGFRDLAR